VDKISYLGGGAGRKLFLVLLFLLSEDEVQSIFLPSFDKAFNESSLKVLLIVLAYSKL
jgi:hypothetical protein